MHGYLTVYKASAGSGKTFTLAAEYIAMIINNSEENHRNVLAVTFTNKATAEMKHRVLKELWDMSYEDDYSSSDFFQAVAAKCPCIDNKQIRERARTALHAILHDYDYFHVETIDSFFQSLLTSLAHELGLSAGAGVEIDDKRVIEQAVDDLLHTVSTRGTIASWLLGYVNEKIMEGKIWNVSDEVKRLAKQATKEIFLANEESLLQMYDKEDIIAGYRDLLLSCKKRAHQKTLDFVAQAQGYVESVGGFQQFSNGKNALSRLLNIISGDADLPTAAYAEKLSDYTKWIKSADKKKGNLQAEAQMLNECLNRVEDAYKEDLFVSNSVDLTVKYINPLRLMGEISRDVAKINSENNRFLLAKTPLLFNKLVGADDASFVFERVGTTYSHIMIDEFQDTSFLQWTNFKRLLVENMSSGNTCMLVGDVKQSIYRFRGGDWKILNGIEAEMEKFGVESKTLNINYRSHSNIIVFNNTIFSAAAQWIGNAGFKETIDKIYADVFQKCNKREGGYAEFSCTIVADKKKKKQSDVPDLTSCENGVQDQEDVLTALYGKIKELQACGMPFSQMAILVRYNGEAKSLVEEFSNNFPDIPVISDEAFWLSSSKAVNLIMCVIRYCIDCNDEVALTYICKSIKDGEKENVPDLSSVIDDKDEMLKKMPGDLVGVCKEKRNMPLLELCEHVIDVFKLNEWEGEAPYLLAFLDGVMEYLEGGSSDYKSFVTYWDESMKKKAIPSCDMPGVRVLTIHKSKGLAFRAVFLPYLDWTMEKDRNDDIMWVLPKEEPYNCLPVIPSSPKSKMKNSIYADAYETEHFDRRVENLNLAYVAFTRAEEFLYVWAKVREEVSISQYDLTIGEALYHASKDLFVGEEDKKIYISGEKSYYKSAEKSIDMPLRTTGESRCNPLKISNASEQFLMNCFPLNATFKQSNSATDFVSDISDKQNDYIDKGKVIHFLFSQIRYAEDVSSALLNVQAKGLVTGKDHLEELKLFVKNRLKNPKVRKWFDKQWCVYNECNILSRDKEGNLKIHRPDRVITNGETTLVIDYKCGKKKEDHKRQVNEYCYFLRSMGHKNVKGYLWYLYPDEVVSSMDETVC